MIRRSSALPTGMVLSVPHGGRLIPQPFDGGLRVPIDHLWSDWDTDALFDLGGELECPSIVNALSRFVADPNRRPTDPLHGDFWRTAVPAADPDGRAIYDRPIPDTELSERIRLAHEEFHRRIGDALDSQLERHERVLLVDLHSFGLPLGTDIVLGDGHGTTSHRRTVARLHGSLAAEGFSVARNRRFTGGWIVRRWASDRVDAVQIELDQRLYLNPEDVEAGVPSPRRNPQAFETTRGRILRALSRLRASSGHDTPLRPGR